MLVAELISRMDHSQPMRSHRHFPHARDFLATSTFATEAVASHCNSSAVKIMNLYIQLDECQRLIDMQD